MSPKPQQLSAERMNPEEMRKLTNNQVLVATDEGVCFQPSMEDFIDPKGRAAKINAKRKSKALATEDLYDVVAPPFAAPDQDGGEKPTIVSGSQFF